MRIYLDHNATAPLAPAVARAMSEAAKVAWGNPSSVHAEGRAARDVVENARRQLAQAIGANPEELIFTSGGTEADVLGVLGLARAARDLGRLGRAATSELEHPAVLGAVRALPDPIVVRPDEHGRIRLDSIVRAIDDGADLVTLQLANHELGTLQDVATLASEARRRGARVHCDAVQGLGRLPVDVTGLGVDTLAISAHKIGGPKGVGALWVAPGTPWASPSPEAGHQERGRRPGTEAVLAIAGFGAAVAGLGERLATAADVARLAVELEAGLVDLGARIHGAGAPRVGNTVNAGFEDAPGEVVATALDLAGVAVSTGAACTSGTVAPSPVMMATGLSEARAREAIRFSLGPENSAADVQATLEVLPDIVARARRFTGSR